MMKNALGALGLLLVVLQIGCSDEAIGHRSKEQPSGPSEEPSPYGLKVLVKVGDGPEKLVTIGPAGQLAAGPAMKGAEPPSAESRKSMAAPEGAPLAPGVRPLATIKDGDATTDTAETDARYKYADGWTLAKWALKSCVPPSNAEGRIEGTPFGTRSFGISAAPWAVRIDEAYGGYYYFYWRGFDVDYTYDCDKALFMQESLLCAADRLAELADSPGTVTWEVPTIGSSDDDMGEQSEPRLTVTIPPQAADDLFVAREMALNILAHVNQLDARPVGIEQLSTLRGSLTCGEMYSMSAEDGTIWDEGYTPYFDPEEFDADSDEDVLRAAGLRRLTRKAMTLSASARLTHELLERSVEQDLAGAQQFLTSGGTSLAAARRAWGVEEGQSPANTFRHAVKMLFGRLEIGNHRDPRVNLIRKPDFTRGDQFVWSPREGMRDDPRCNGVVRDSDEEGSGELSNDSLFTLGGSTSVRWQDVPPSSREEAHALSLLVGAGIVLPPALALTAEQLTGSSSVIVDELVRQAAMRAKPADITAEAAVTQFLSEYEDSEFGRAFASSLGEIPPSAWRFAAARAFGTFRMMSHADPDAVSDVAVSVEMLRTIAARAGVPVSDDASGIEAVGGIVIPGGLTRKDLSADAFAMFANAQLNANCGAHPLYELSPNRVIDPQGTSVLGFQNAFLLGQAFERHLADIARAAGKLADEAPELTKVVHFAEASAAEAREWAGPGFMTRFIMEKDLDEDESVPDRYSALEFVNVSFEDLGVENLDELVDRLVLARDSVDSRELAWVECLAGERDLCPEVSESPARLVTAFAGETIIGDQSSGGSIYRHYSLHHPVIRIKFTHLSDLDRYAVIRAKGGRPGRVLGFLPGSGGLSERFVEPISHRQRELANRVFGLSQNNDINRTCSTVPPLSMPSEYCIAGMDREQFVPLANSITSTSGATEDSFKHYLDVAEQTAARADELGRQLIELGLQQDIRSEAAAEEVSQICGAYPNDANLVQFSDGKADEPVDDPAIAACITPETVDVVFLRRDLAVESGKSQDELCAVFCGEGDSFAPFCSRKCENGARKTGTDAITTAGLGLLSDAVPPMPTLGSCSAVANSFVDGTVDLSSLDAAVNDGTVSATSLAIALNGLRLIEHDDGQWMLVSGGRPVMGSGALVASTLSTLGIANAVSDVWPLCEANCSERALLLKQAFPIPAGDDTSRYPALRRSVERAVFFMGAMAGSVPEGVFQVPLPAIDRDEVDGEIAAPAFYPPARFEELGSTGRYQPVANEYQGVGSYPLSASKAMPDLIVPSDGLTEFLTDRQASKTQWRREFFESASAWHAANPRGVLMTAPIGNALIRFDEVLDPQDASSTRDNLGQWLKRVLSDYENGSLTPARVQQATFYRAANGDGNPLQFCARAGQDGEFFEGAGQELLHGRQVCTNAPVSPVFYTTSPAFDPLRAGATDSCLETPVPGHIFSTHRARAVDKGKVHYVTTPGGDPESVTAVQDWEIGWFRLMPAVGIEKRDGCEVEGDDYCLNPDEDGFSWSQVVSPSCAGQKLWTIGVNTPTAACEHYNGFYGGRTFTYGGTAMVPHDRLRPDVCPAPERVELFIESDVVESQADKTDPKHAVEVLVRALTLACATAHADANPAVPPPRVKTVQDMLYLEAWTATYARSVWQSADLLYLVDVPKSLLDVMQVGGANVNAVTQGDQGQLLLELEKNVRLVESSISSLGIELGNLSRAVGEARVGIHGIELEAKGKALELQLARVEYARQAAVIQAVKAREAITAAITNSIALAAGAVACVGTGGVGCAFVAVALATNKDNIPFLMDFAGVDNPHDISLEAAENSQKIVDEQAALNGELKSNRIQSALIAMNDRMQGTQQQIAGHLTSLGNSVSSSLQNIGKLEQSQSGAAIALAKASGGDFAKLAAQGREIPLHVNTVYRRQFDVTLQRYHRALLSAKRAAYLARLAVEERLGVRLDDLNEAIGPLEAPALWADNLCTVQGVNYSELREAIPSDASNRDELEIDKVRGFANQYVGDYVAQLREFVEFYNLEFPFANAQDVALISLRSDIQDPSDRCLEPSPNLLFYSDQLAVSAPDVVRGPTPTYGGWNFTGCDQSYCVEAATGASLLATTVATSPPLSPPTPGGASWLYTRARSLAQVVSTDEVGTITSDQEPALVGKPSGYVFQTVELEAGKDYVLSWWDQARSTDGAALSSATTAIGRAGVFDGDWQVIALDSFQSTPDWSERRMVRVVVPVSGPYHIAFSPSRAGSTGSMVIANVQLEEIGHGAGGSVPYVSNAGSRMQLSSKCNTNPATFLARFDYKCGDDGCWHVLRDPLFIDMEAVNQGGSSLVGKVSQGNFNHRLGGVALNLVGTGLRDCSGQGSSCYGTGYVEYDLEHAAFNVPLEDYSNQVSCFDFGRGNIRSAKALATERFLTIPLGSTDRDIINAPPFLKTELSGRPLSGSYKLRIKDSPGLVWSALEDVQIILNYDYWSRVDIARPQ